MRRSSLLRDLGVVDVIAPGARETLEMRSLLMPSVVVVRLRTDRLRVRIGHGRLREVYPDAISLIAEGSMSYATSGRRRSFGKAGEVLLLNERTDRQTRPAVLEFDDAFEGFLILADARFETRASPEHASIPRESPLVPSFIAFLRSLTTSDELWSPHPAPTAAQAAERMTTHIFDALTLPQRVLQVFDGHGRRDVLTDALLAIRASAHSPCTTPASIARQTNVSLSQLHRCFERHERTVAEEIRFQRTRLALEALHSDSLMDIETIARAAGFSSSRTMRRAVIAVSGLTPADIRRQGRSRRQPERRGPATDRQAAAPTRPPGTEPRDRAPRRRSPPSSDAPEGQS